MPETKDFYRRLLALWPPAGRAPADPRFLPGTEFAQSELVSGYKLGYKYIGMKYDFEVGNALSKEFVQIAATHVKLAHSIKAMLPDVAQEVSPAFKC